MFRFRRLFSSSNVTHPQINPWFIFREKKEKEREISLERGCHLVKFNASLDKARSYIFLCSGKSGFRPAFFKLEFLRVIFVAEIWRRQNRGIISQPTNDPSRKPIDRQRCFIRWPAVTTGLSDFREKSPEDGIDEGARSPLSLPSPISHPFSAILCGSRVRSPSVVHRPPLASSYSPPIRWPFHGTKFSLLLA